MIIIPTVMISLFLKISWVQFMFNNIISTNTENCYPVTKGDFRLVLFLILAYASTYKLKLGRVACNHL